MVPGRNDIEREECYGDTVFVTLERILRMGSSYKTEGRETGNAMELPADELLPIPYDTI